jgi:hypothetical protein
MTAIANKDAAYIRELEARLWRSVETAKQTAARIEALEAALRVAKEYVCDIHALRVINAALAPALCPTSDPSWPESQPCSVCGAFGPWFDTPQIGECVEATRTARAPEQDK